MWQGLVKTASVRSKRIIRYLPVPQTVFSSELLNTKIN